MVKAEKFASGVPSDEGQQVEEPNRRRFLSCCFGRISDRLTSQLVNKFQNLVVEDLNVSSMMQGKTPKARADADIAEIRRQLII